MRVRAHTRIISIGFGYSGYRTQAIQINHLSVTVTNSGGYNASFLSIAVTESGIRTHFEAR